MIWMSLVLLYGLLKGARELAKKKAMESNSVMEVLFLYTLLSFASVFRFCLAGCARSMGNGAEILRADSG